MMQLRKIVVYAQSGYEKRAFCKIGFNIAIITDVVGIQLTNFRRYDFVPGILVNHTIGQKDFDK